MGAGRADDERRLVKGTQLRGTLSWAGNLDDVRVTFRNGQEEGPVLGTEGDVGLSEGIAGGVVEVDAMPMSPKLIVRMDSWLIADSS